MSYDIDKASLKGFEKIEAILIDSLEAPVYGPIYGLSSSENQDIFDKSSDVLKIMGNPTLVGCLGSGQIAKLANQIIVGVLI